jgi:hypothetical protein
LQQDAFYQADEEEKIKQQAQQLAANMRIAHQHNATAERCNTSPAAAAAALLIPP